MNIYVDYGGDQQLQVMCYLVIGGNVYDGDFEQFDEVCYLVFFQFVGELVGGG